MKAKTKARGLGRYAVRMHWVVAALLVASCRDFGETAHRSDGGGSSDGGDSGEPSSTGGVPSSTGGVPSSTGGVSSSTGGVSPSTGGSGREPPSTGGAGGTAARDGGDGRDGDASNGEVTEGGATDEWLAKQPGLALWLDSAVGVVTDGLPSNPKVATWHDRSGRANDARQEVVGARPRWVNGAVNGLPAAQFNGRAYLAVDDAPSIQFGTNDFVVALVGAWTNPTIQTSSSFGWAYLVQKQADQGPYTGILVAANEAGPNSLGRLFFQVRFGDSLQSASTALNDGEFRLYLARRRSAAPNYSTLELRINAAEVGSADVPLIDASAVGAKLQLGGSADPQPALQGHIAEVVMIGGPLDDDAIGELERYFNEKYALW